MSGTITITGILVATPKGFETKYGNGFRIGSSDSYKDKDGEWKSTSTQRFSVISTDTHVLNFNKGDRLLIIGKTYQKPLRVEGENYEKQETNIRAKQVFKLYKKSDNGNESQTSDTNYGNGSYANYGSKPSYDPNEEPF